MLRARAVLVSVALVAVLGAAPSPASAGTHPHFNDRGTLVWYRSLPEAQAAARASGKLIFMESGRLECGSCRKLVERTIPQEPIRGRLAAIAVGLADDCDVAGSAAGGLLSRNLPGATFLPLVGFATADGRWITGWFGGATPAQVLSHLEIAEKAHARLGAPSDAPAAAPTPRAVAPVPAPTPRAVAPVPVPAPTPRAATPVPAPTPRVATPVPAPTPRAVAPAPQTGRGVAPAPLARTSPPAPVNRTPPPVVRRDAPVAPAPPTTPPRTYPAPLAARPPAAAPSPTAPRAAPVPPAPTPVAPRAIAQAPATPNPTGASGSATGNDARTRARAAAEAGDWGAVLRIWEDAGNSRDATVLADLSPYAERAHLWCLRQVDDAERAAQSKRYADAKRSLELVRRCLEGTTCPIAVDAERGERAVERLMAIEQGSPDQPDAPEALRRRSYQEFRGSRWAPLFRSRS